MSEFEIGKEMAVLQDELQKTQALVNEIYKLVDHNIKKKNLTEPPVEKK